MDGILLYPKHNRLFWYKQIFFYGKYIWINTFYFIYTLAILTFQTTVLIVVKLDRTANAAKAFILIKMLGYPLVVYSLFPCFCQLLWFGPVFDEVLSCPKGLHVWLVLPVATLVW